MKAPELPVRPLEEIRAGLGALRPALVASGASVPEVLKGLPRAEGDHDLAIAVVERETLGASVALLSAHVAPGGAVMLIARAPGLFGVGGASAPDASALTEALLSVGAVEIHAATTPGTLRRELVVWGRMLDAT